MPNHDYTTRIQWTGNRGEGTAHYKAYDRTWDVAVPGKAPVHCSNDPLLGGDPGIYSARWAGEPRDFYRAMERVEEALQASG